MVTNNSSNQKATGYQSLTSGGVYNGRTISAGSGISISNGDGTSGNTTITATSPLSPTPNPNVQMFDDLLNLGTINGTDRISGSQWTTNFDSTNALDAGHPGLLTNSSFASASQYMFLGGASSTTSTFILGGGALTINFVVNIAILSVTTTAQYVLRCGLGDTLNGDQANGCYVEYTNGTNSGQWQFKTAKSSTRTTSSSTTAVTTGWHNIQVSVNAAGTSISYSVDGVSLGTAITTNIPITTITPFISVSRTAGTVAANTIYPDLFYLNQTLTATR